MNPYQVNIGQYAGDFFSTMYDTWGGYWTVVFNPTGQHIGRYSEIEARRYAEENNALFSTPEAKSSRFAGKKIRTYHADGSLKSEDTILSVASFHPKLKVGTRVALLNNGKQVTGRDEDFERWTATQVGQQQSPQQPYGNQEWQPHAENLTEHTARDYESYYRGMGYEVKIVPSKRYAGRFDMYIKKR